MENPYPYHARTLAEESRKEKLFLRYERALAAGAGGPTSGARENIRQRWEEKKDPAKIGTSLHTTPVRRWLPTHQTVEARCQDD